MINKKYEELGPITFHESSVLILFIIALLLWFFQEPGFMTGWADKLETTNASGPSVSVADATPAMFILLLLFILPSKPYFIEALQGKREFESSPALLDWKFAQAHVAWGVMLQVGGGYALAEASDQSCLSSWLGSQLTGLESLPDWVICLIACLICNILTQVLSNSAAVSMLLPVLRDLALELGINPLYLMLAPTISSCYAFMLPISTGPNAIIYGPSRISIKEMIKIGFVMNGVCLCVVLVSVNTYGAAMFDLREFPDWAKDYNSGNITDPCANI